MRLLRYTGLAVVIVAVLVAGAWFWLLHTTPGARWILAQAEQAAGLTVASVEGNVGEGLRLGRVHYVNETVSVSVASLEARIDIDVAPFSIEVVSATARTVDVSVTAEDTQDEPGTDLAGALQRAALPFPLQVSQFAAHDIRIASARREQRLASVSLRGRWHEHVEVEKLTVRTAELSASASGTLDLLRDNALHADVSARLMPVLTDFPEPLDVSVALQGYPHELGVQARVASFLTASGNVTLGDGVAGTADIVLDGLDLQTLVDDWPAGFALDGTIRASIDEDRIRVRESELLIVGTAARIVVDAEMDRRTENIGGQLRWQKLRWPLPLKDTRVRSESGDLTLSGNADDWTVTGSIDVSTDEFPGGSFVIDGRGTRDGISGRIVDSKMLGGRAAGRVAYEFSGEGAWSAELDLDGIHLDALLPDWPGRVSGHVNGRGTSEPFSMAAELRGVTGRVRGTDLKGSGAIDIRNGVFAASDLRIEHGTSRLVVDGAPMTARGLRFEVDIDDAGAYSDAVTGAVVARGRLSFVEHGAFLNASIGSPAFGIGDSRFEDVAITLAASDDEQTMSVSGKHLETLFEFGLTGRFGDWRRPHETRFDGIVDTFEIDLEDRHAMSLVRAAPLSLSREAVSVQALCIADRTGSELCTNARWREDGRYAANLSLSRVPVDFIEHVADVGFRFDQKVSGTFRWDHDPTGTTSGGGTLELTAGTVSPIDDPESTVETGEGRVDFTIRDGRLLRGVVQLPLPGRGDISGHFVMHDVTLGGASEIEGALDVDISNIRVLSRLSPLIDSASGALRATATLAGTMAEPSITGEFGLERGRFVYLPIGLDVEDVNLEGTMDSDYRLDVAGTFRAGDGRGEIVSQADYSDAADPGLSFKLRGNNLVLVNVPDVTVRIDPDIDITLDRNTLTINGSLNVPQALIRPRNLSGAKVNESNDVVIVAGELPDPPEEASENGDFDYRGKLAVTLGRDVVIDVDLAKASVTGAAKFNWQGDMIPIADGRYFINGSIAAFGQVLEVSEGWVHFPKVPANEPLIRIMAEREIFGNTQVKRAGVFIDGPVQRPTVEAYTQPLTTEERALALLVTGSDFDYEQGVGAIDFGTYIAPRLFVSYGVGVFERENIISARFDLSKSFGIKASSGSKESGIDLNYRFEN